MQYGCCFLYVKSNSTDFRVQLDTNISLWCSLLSLDISQTKQKSVTISYLILKVLLNNFKNAFLYLYLTISYLNIIPLHLVLVVVLFSSFLFFLFYLKFFCLCIFLYDKCIVFMFCLDLNTLFYFYQTLQLYLHQVF